MKYSKSNSEYFRNKKGGGLETNGKLNAENFNSNTKPVELDEMNSSNNTTKIKPIKIMVKKKSSFKKLFGKFLSDEHYIFFGYNPKTGIYEYVCYVNQDFSQLNTKGSPIICKKREDNGKIVELSHHDFLNIDARELSILFYHLLLIHEKNQKLINEDFFRYLFQFILPIILNTEIHNKNYMNIISKIKTMLDINNKNNNEEGLPRRTPRKDNNNNFTNKPV